MPLVAFRDLMSDAARHRYAVGYFESFSLESLLAVTDAAEAECSPVILGFSGIYLPHPARQVRDRLATYAAMGLAVCRDLTVPACLLFNECPHAGWVEAAIALGFSLVMFSDDALDDSGTVAMIARMVDLAHARGAATKQSLLPFPASAATSIPPQNWTPDRLILNRRGASLQQPPLTRFRSILGRCTFTDGASCAWTSIDSARLPLCPCRSFFTAQHQSRRAICKRRSESACARSMSAAG
jgi:Fructose-bisphosphate aldolase class-II